MRNTIIAFLWLCQFVAYGQNAHFETLQKINDALTPEGIILGYEADFSYFDQLASTQPSSTMKIKTIIGKGHYWAKFEAYELFGDGQWHCMLDHHSKTITLTGAKQRNAVPGADLAAFVELAKEQHLQLKAFNPAGRYKGLRFEAPEHSKTKIDLIYEPDTYYLNKSIIKIEVDNPDIQLEFNHCKIAASYSNYRKIEGEFPYSLTHFLKKTSHGFQPAAAYAGYQLRSF